ncbi:unnamed protein product [Paramecium octaurelia]|uniref:Transmembrane protein n=1 Tax=Paramecium octaurelia TaxID=43137 RepID=A0A8S1X424_PAROT|nr:unnamed protein product [Paramecium octaurelia]CAD8195759.1 unnamed protein product [Paramecium octaurelia]
MGKQSNYLMMNCSLIQSISTLSIQKLNVQNSLRITMMQFQGLIKLIYRFNSCQFVIFKMQIKTSISQPNAYICLIILMMQFYGVIRYY